MAEEEPQIVSMVVPEGATPGTKLQYAAPDGQELRLTVPEGVPPGSIMTLTQDPVSKQWKCMAEPGEAQSPPPQPQPQQLQYEQPPQVLHLPEFWMHEANMAAVPAYSMPGPYHAPAPAVERYLAPQMSTQATAPAAAPATVTSYPAGQAPQIISRSTVVQPMPVNLSYVPPPANSSVTMAPGQIQYGAPVPAPLSMATDPSLFNPPRQMPDGLMYMEQQPSYTPPPVHVMEQRPSYTPLPQPQVFMHDQRPSYTPPPVMTYQAPPQQPQLMSTSSTKVQPGYLGQPVLAQSPSYVPPPEQGVAPVPYVSNGPSYVPPPVAMGATAPAQGADQASVQLPAGLIGQGPAPSISAVPQQPIPMASYTGGFSLGGATMPMPITATLAQPAPGPPHYMGSYSLGQPGYGQATLAQPAPGPPPSMGQHWLGQPGYGQPMGQHFAPQAAPGQVSFGQRSLAQPAMGQPLGQPMGLQMPGFLGVGGPAPPMYHMQGASASASAHGGPLYGVPSAPMPVAEAVYQPPPPGQPMHFGAQPGMM